MKKDRKLRIYVAKGDVMYIRMLKKAVLALFGILLITIVIYLGILSLENPTYAMYFGLASAFLAPIALDCIKIISKIGSASPNEVVTKNTKPKNTLRYIRSLREKFLIFRYITNVIIYFLCFIVFFFSLNIYINADRMLNNMDKDWIEFMYLLYEDQNVGIINFTLDGEIYFTHENSKTVIARQVCDNVIAQVYNTTFEIKKADTYVSPSKKFTLIASLNNVNLFNSITGELIDDFTVDDDKVYTVLFDEDKKNIYILSETDGNISINVYNIDHKEISMSKAIGKYTCLGLTKDRDYFVGLDSNYKLFLLNLDEYMSDFIYGDEALLICYDNVEALRFDTYGKYYVDVSFSYNTQVSIIDCQSGKDIYTMYVEELSNVLFDNDENVFIVHDNKVEKINLLTKHRKTVLDLSTIAERKNERRVDYDYKLLNTCLINGTKYMVGIVYEPSYNYNRIYIFDLETEHIVGLSNSIGDYGETILMIYGDKIFAGINNNKGISMVWYQYELDESNILRLSQDSFLRKIFY